MSRIIAGKYGGRRLSMPTGNTTRPTSERIREAIFARLEHLEILPDANVLDLYAGSGSLGLEALSRGAARATFVEANRSAYATLAKNVAALGDSAAHTVNDRVERFLDAWPAASVDLVLLDPPYDIDEADLTRVLALLAPTLRPEAVVLVERGKRSGEPQWPEGMSHFDRRQYGDTVIWLADMPAEQPENGDDHG